MSSPFVDLPNVTVVLIGQFFVSYITALILWPVDALDMSRTFDIQVDPIRDGDANKQNRSHETGIYGDSLPATTFSGIPTTYGHFTSGHTDENHRLFTPFSQNKTSCLACCDIPLLPASNILAPPIIVLHNNYRSRHALDFSGFGGPNMPKILFAENPPYAYIVHCVDHSGLNLSCFLSLRIMRFRKQKARFVTHLFCDSTMLCCPFSFIKTDLANLAWLVPFFSNIGTTLAILSPITRHSCMVRGKLHQVSISARVGIIFRNASKNLPALKALRPTRRPTPARAC